MLYAKKMSFTPVSASISASANVAHLCFVIPESTCNRTTSRILCVLQCGRSRDASPAISTIRSMLLSTKSRKTTSPGEMIWLVSSI